jgi:2-polyprenyl-3-methyl-5-hydroxy-6-metoxy-1,4-benzoquinol methylase
MAHTRTGRKDSAPLRETYTSAYYLQDCGGFDQYARTGGRRIDEDAWLLAVAAVAGLKTSGRILDLGCGRGELAHYFAERGFEITAVDYSEATIELVEQTFRDEPNLRTRVELICSDVCSVPLSGYYDVAAALDMIEHLSPEELDRLYARVAKHLSADGIFVVHTDPNLWYFKYDYVRKRRIASDIGTYLPAQPRTRYERLMHINEQSPRVLKRSLKRHFNSVLLWFANKDTPGGSLLEKFSHRQMCAAPDLFAVASHSSIDVEKLKDRFRSDPLSEIGLSDTNLAVRQAPFEILAGNHCFSHPGAGQWQPVRARQLSALSSAHLLSLAGSGYIGHRCIRRHALGYQAAAQSWNSRILSGKSKISKQAGKLHLASQPGTRIRTLVRRTANFSYDRCGNPYSLSCPAGSNHRKVAISTLNPALSAVTCANDE